MVLEQIIKNRWIKGKEHAVLLAFIYSLIALISARLIFPKSIGLMSIAFTSVLLIPSLNNLLAAEENQNVREKKHSLKLLWRDHNDIIKVYILMFLGIFLAYGITAVLFDTTIISSWFSPQLRAAGITGKAIDSSSVFLSIVKNNLIIFLVCFLLSLVYGAGAVIFLAWNASVWGVVFGFFAKISSLSIGINKFSYFFNQLIPFLPHMLTEGLSYVGAAIVGGILSKAIIREKIGTKNFNKVFIDALMALGVGIVVVIAAGVIEVYLFGSG